MRALLVFAAMLPSVSSDRVVTSFDFDVSPIISHARRFSATDSAMIIDSHTRPGSLPCGLTLTQMTLSYCQWKFSRGENAGYNQTSSSCPVSRFPINLDGLRCNGMRQATSSADASLDACRSACCAAAEGCEMYQFNPTNPTGACWVGLLPSDVHNPAICVNDTAWTSRGRADCENTNHP